MAIDHLGVVRKSIKSYADRGIFGGFSERAVGKGKSRFEFVWLYNRRFTLEFDETKGTLRFRECFPAMPAQSEAYGAVQDFVKSRTDKKLPAHRRIDEKRAEAKSATRKGKASLVLAVKRNQYKYGVTKIVNLLHETFLMIDQCFTEYLYEHFDLPEE